MLGNPLAVLALFGWLPLVIYFFIRFSPERAVIISVLGAWLFLPLSSFKFLPVVPPYDRMSAAFYGILIATVIFYPDRFRTVKFSWIDIPVIVICLCPLPTSITNDLGAYDGLVNAVGQSVAWGLPYYVGRLYMSNLSAMRQLAIGTFIGGILYILPCLYEIRLFTSLHLRLYGFQLFNSFAMAIRLGGYRPSVFLPFGLAVGVWMMTASLVGVVLWRAKTIKKIWNIPVFLFVVAVVVTFILVKSTGAYALLAYGLVIMFVAKWFRTEILMWAFIIGIMTYITLGAIGSFPRDDIISSLSTVFDSERLASLDFRFYMEKLLSAHAREKFLFGWGGFGRNRVMDQSGQDAVTDSLWIITFGIYGALGLYGTFGALLLPVAEFCRKVPARLWSSPNVAPAAALAAGVVMYALDSVLNAMVNPTYILVCGGLAGLAINYEK